MRNAERKEFYNEKIMHTESFSILILLFIPFLPLFILLSF